jgi:hypothetical protein
MEKLSYSLIYLGPKPNPTPNRPSRPPLFLFHTRGPGEAQWPVGARARLVFLTKTRPSSTLPPPTENPPSANRNPVQTSIGDSVGAIFLLRTIGEQNPYK